MANELKHQDPGIKVTADEYKHAEAHYLEGAVNYDIPVAYNGKLIKKTLAEYRALLDIPTRMPDNFGRVIRIKDNVSPEGDIFSALTQINAGQYLDIQPGAGEEACIHNIYWEADVTITVYDGADTIAFRTEVGAGGLPFVAFHVTNTQRIRVQNNDAGAKRIGYDGIYTPDGDIFCSHDQIANNAWQDLQPAAGYEAVVHNIYWEDDIELEFYDGANAVTFDTEAGAGYLSYYAFYCTNTLRIRVKNVAGALKHIAYDGVYTKVP